MDQELTRLIGQMMMVGFAADNVDDLLQDIEKYRFGNVILFSRNFKSAEQLTKITAKIQEVSIKHNGVPAFISVDQEGGCACRFYEGVTTVPGAMAQAAASEKHHNVGSQCGHIIGSDLKRLGVNFDLAPVADINTNPYNPVIAVRSYSDNPILVSQLAADFSAGLQSVGVLSCYKHFLGHGDVDVDSRLELPRVQKSFSQLDLCEMIPYKSARIGDAVMAAHILYSDIDDKFPASLSYRILHDLLRDKLKYMGLIISDCFEMGALQRVFSLSEAAVYAVNAGVDIIPVSHVREHQIVVRNAILAGVLDGTIKRETIEQAVARIEAMKKKYATEETPVPATLDNRKTAERISEASITLISGKQFAIDAETVVIGVSGANAVGITGTEFPEPGQDVSYRNLDVAQSIGKAFNIEYRSIDNKNFNVAELVEFARGKKVILCLSDSHIMLVQRVLYNALLHAQCRVMLLSMRTPYDVLNQEQPECHLAAYEYSALSIASLIKVLRGAAAFGVCPVRFGRKNQSGKTEDTRNYTVDNIIRYIKNNFAKHLTLDSVAAEFYISGFHLCKLMKRKLNKNFIDVVNEIRVEEAKKLLGTTPMRIYEIATQCGFSDINYFTKTFKRYTTVTPTYYRNHIPS